MMKSTMALFAAMLFAAATLSAVSGAAAQMKDGDKAHPGKKYVVRILTIENGDTTVTDQAVDGEGEELTWVGEDGNEFTVIVADGDEADEDADMKEDMTVEVLGKEKHREYMFRSGKDGRPMKFIVKKGGGGHAEMDCCGGGSCAMTAGKGKMDMEKMHRMHPDMDKEEMMRMHEKMDKKEMMRMHEKMQKKMMWKEKKEKDDDDEGEDEDDDSDSEKDDDGGSLL
jgi:hypothetical protein